MPDLNEFLSEIESGSVGDQPDLPLEGGSDTQPPSTQTAAPPAAEADKGETSAPPAPELPPRADDGKFQKREQQSHMVPLEALLAERERRQAAERLAEEHAREEQEAKPKPDFWDDPEAAVAAAVAAREAELLAKADARSRENFLRFAENAAKGRYSDYDDMRAAFATELERNPALAQQWREAADPAEFIYQTGKAAKEMREVGGDLAAYRQRIEAEARQKWEREMQQKTARQDAIPQSLNTEPSRGAGIVGGSWTGPTPLEDILPRGRDQ
jgi:hypothetical protein